MLRREIYTDGSCIGQPGRRFAGYGLCWLSDDGKTWIERSAPLAVGPQTNQRSELAAIHAALELISYNPFNPPITHILTDSQYAINCITTWIHSWRRNNWQTSKREPVLNRDLIEPAALLYEALRPAVTLEWVKGHSGESEGNHRADTLATAAAAAAAASTAGC